MITEQMIWNIFQQYMPRKQWISKAEMNHIIQVHGNLGTDDWQPLSARSKMPTWKVRVSYVLANKAKHGIIRSRKSSRKP